MIPLESPPIRETLFTAESYDDSEYWRRLKPNGSQYQSEDCASQKHCHAGYDLQGDYHEPLLATNDGTVRWTNFNFGPSFGVQTLLIPTGEDYGIFYAHQAWRTISDGQRVKAGQKIGAMGTSGGVQQHLHLGATTKVTGGVPCWFNPGPALRELKEDLLPLSDTDLDRIVARLKPVIADAVKLSARVIVKALNMGADGANWFSDQEDQDLAAYNIKKVRDHQ